MKYKNIPFQHIVNAWRISSFVKNRKAILELVQYYNLLEETELTFILTQTKKVNYLNYNI